MSYKVVAASLILVSLLVSLPVGATPEWAYLGSTKNGDQAFLDTGSIQLIDEQTRSFNGKMIFARIQENVSALVMNAILQCNNKVVEVHEINLYPNKEAGGAALQTIVYEIPLFRAMDETEMDSNTFEKVCQAEIL